MFFYDAAQRPVVIEPITAEFEVSLVACFPHQHANNRPRIALSNFVCCGVPSLSISCRRRFMGLQVVGKGKSKQMTAPHLFQLQEAAFATLGDWGGYGAGGWYLGYQQGVAAGLSSKATQANISFVVNVGDSFYWTGVKSTADKQWKAGFEEIYSTESLNVPWILDFVGLPWIS